ncbi:MAG TPA: hypothetical protein VN799_02050, partial [Acidimicrobiales bacterium]|nr:hypothetical protein [Acidimicrobiales bacterium]
ATGECFTVGIDSSFEGVIVPIPNGVPATAEVVSGTYYLEGLACESSTNCVAVGQSPSREAEAVTVPINDGVIGIVQAVPGASDLYGVTCEGTTTCIAVGQGFSGAVVVAITDGVPGKLQSLPGTNSLWGVSCLDNADTCLAAGLNTSPSLQGDLLPIDNGSAGTIQTVSGTYEFMGVDCSSTTTCVVVGEGTSGQGVVMTTPSG